MIQLYIYMYQFFSKFFPLDFPDGPVVKNPPANAGDTGSVLGLGRADMLWGN